MRLWSLHPKYLDAQGLVALWREALLAQAVLRGKTRGYRHHPQLDRFRGSSAPLAAINAYLAAVYREASARGHRFDKKKIGPVRKVKRMAVSSAQLAYEWRHLLAKLKKRNPPLHRKWRALQAPQCHPLLFCKPGGIVAG